MIVKLRPARLVTVATAVAAILAILGGWLSLDNTAEAQAGLPAPAQRSSRERRQSR